MTEKAVRKTTTKKPVRKAAPKKVASKTVTAKKLTPKKKLAPKTPVRKAPTPVAATKANKERNNRVLFVGVFAFVCIIGGSIALGMSGSGEISIETRIADIKENATPEERNLIESIPVQKTALPDGGLVPSGVPVEVPAPKPVATSTEGTATSTENTATSTQNVAIDEDQQPEEVADESIQE